MQGEKVASPPHNRDALDRAVFDIVKRVGLLIKEQRPLPPVLVEAYVKWQRLIADNDAWREGRRVEHLAYPMHYVAEVGDRATICGLWTNDRHAPSVPYGWIGEGGEFRQRRLDRGGAVCDRCMS